MLKLKQSGVSGSPLKLLNDHRRVVLNGYTADFSIVDCGIPQWSVRRPL